VHRNILDRLRSIPGVESAGLASLPPMAGTPDATVVRILGREIRKDENPLASYTITSPGYFSTLHVPIFRGRDFLETDNAHSTPVTLISRTMARKFWPGQDPLGTQIGLGSPDFPAMTVIGIAGDVKHQSLREEPGPEMYVPYTQKPFPSMLLMHFVVRAKGDPASLAAGIRRAVHSVDAGLPIAKVTTLQILIEGSLEGQRFAMVVLSAFAGIALLLALFGMYSVISYSVVQRTREIGIRLALGAERRNVWAAVIGQGVRLTGFGTAIGLCVALVITRLLADFLFGVKPADISTFSLAILLLLATAILACYLPARRATQIDPIAALRCD
jgi:putative ABC transport system permease protein